MRKRTFLDILDGSSLTTSKVLERIFNGGKVTPEDLPNAFDKKGNVLLRFRDEKKVYNTFCPFHDGQKNGDSFALYNHDKKAVCFGNCDFSDKPMNLIQIVMATVLKKDASIVLDFDLLQPYFWEAAQFLVEEFGDELSLKIEDIKQKEFRPNKTEEILNATADYYHFLATKNNFYKKKILKFLKEQRFFDYGVVPLSELIEDFRLGITPFQKDSMDKLYQFLKSKKFTDKEILDSKVCVERNGKIQDFFIGRVIVPYIFNGKVVGLYGRDSNPNGDKKYAHLRLEAEVKVPNGLSNILNEKDFFLVEGEFSKIAVAALGYPNVMETRGVNGFKEEHAQMIGKVAKNGKKCQRCYILFDPDSSGADSVEKIGRKLLDVGVEVLAIKLPIVEFNNEILHVDPNDLLKVYKNKAKDKFESLKNKAMSYDAFVLLHKIEKDAPSTLTEARKVFAKIADLFDNIPPFERIFVIEEMLELLNTVIDKEILRDYLKEVWLRRPEQMKGLNNALEHKEKFIILTKDKTLFEKTKRKYPNFVYVKDAKTFSKKLDETVLNKKIVVDQYFNEEEKKLLNSYQKVISSELLLRDNDILSIKLNIKNKNA